MRNDVPCNVPASWRTIGSCATSSNISVRMGIARGSCIWPRQYASSCFNRADSSLKHLWICSMAWGPPIFFKVNSARNLSFSGRFFSLKTWPIAEICLSLTFSILLFEIVNECLDQTEMNINALIIYEISRNGVNCGIRLNLSYNEFHTDTQSVIVLNENFQA